MLGSERVLCASVRYLSSDKSFKCSLLLQLHCQLTKHPYRFFAVGPHQAAVLTPVLHNMAEWLYGHVTHSLQGTLCELLRKGVTE